MANAYISCSCKILIISYNIRNSLACLQNFAWFVTNISNTEKQFWCPKIIMLNYLIYKCPPNIYYRPSWR